MSDKKESKPTFARRALFGGLGRRAAGFVARPSDAAPEEKVEVKPGELVEHKPEAIQRFLAKLAENNARRKG